MPYHSRMLFTLKLVTLPHVQAVYGRPADGAGVIWEHAVSMSEQTVRVIRAPRTEHKGSILAYWLSSTDHKVIGHMYLITSFFFFLCAGVMALLMRIQLTGPDQRVMSDHQYNELFSIGFLVTFLFGGITGIILASPPMDFAVSDSYFVVAHFHYVLAGTVLFAMFAGFYFWWPKMTGKMLNSRIGKIRSAMSCPAVQR